MERPTEEMEMDDRLSELPEHVLLRILSFLPTKRAAQTSLLSRRFHRLWESFPVLDLDLYAFRRCDCSDFVDLANRTILHRDPPSPLHSLRLDLYDGDGCYSWFDHTLLTPSYISSLLLKAISLGLRHLTVSFGSDMYVAMSPLLFSLSSLESLSLARYDCAGKMLVSSLPPITLTHLKSLSISMQSWNNDLVNHIISHLHALENLHLVYFGRRRADQVDLKSVTIKRFKLFLSCRNLNISAPSLESFELESGLVKYFHWEMPLLKKAIIRLKHVSATSVSTTCEILKAVAHVEDLHLDIEEIWGLEYPFHALLVPGVDLPTYFTLKHFKLEVCFHDYNIEDLVTLLEHSPALESLKLVHKPPVCGTKNKKKKLWRFELPRNANFKDLHINENRTKVIEQLTSKRF